MRGGFLLLWSSLVLSAACGQTLDVDLSPLPAPVQGDDLPWVTAASQADGVHVSWPAMAKGARFTITYRKVAPDGTLSPGGQMLASRYATSAYFPVPAALDAFQVYSFEVVPWGGRGPGDVRARTRGPQPATLVPDRTYTNTGRFGTAIVGVGDQDNIVGDEFLVSAPFDDRVYRLSWDPVAAPFIFASGGPGLFGEVLTAGGDWNDDGYTDFMISNPTVNMAGELRLYQSTNTPAGIFDENPPVAQAQYGADAAVGHLRTPGGGAADAYPDLFVSRPHLSAPESQQRAYTFEGRVPSATPPPFGNPTVLDENPTADPWLGFGKQVEAIDLDGDPLGFDELILSTNIDGDLPQIEVWKTEDAGPIVRQQAIRAIAPQTAAFGDEMVAADFDGDGHGDVAVSDIGAANISIYRGGNPAPSPTPGLLYGSPDLTLTGTDPVDRFGVSTDSADVNGDGYSDLLVGAPGASNGGADAGEVTLYLGPDLTPAWTIAGATTDQLGGTVAVAGDVDGDGCADLATRRRIQNSNVEIYRGGITTVPELRPHSATRAEPSGTHVSVVGPAVGENLTAPASAQTCTIFWPDGPEEIRDCDPLDLSSHSRSVAPGTHTIRLRVGGACRYTEISFLVVVP